MRNYVYGINSFQGHRYECVHLDEVKDLFQLLMAREGSTPWDRGYEISVLNLPHWGSPSCMLAFAQSPSIVENGGEGAGWSGEKGKICL